MVAGKEARVARAKYGAMCSSVAISPRSGTALRTAPAPLLE